MIFCYGLLYYGSKIESIRSDLIALEKEMKQHKLHAATIEGESRYVY